MRSKAALDLGHLRGEAFDATAEPAQDSDRDLRAWPQPSRRAGKSLAGELPKPLADVLGRGHNQRAQLVQGGGARPDGTAPLEQKQAQVLAPSATTRDAQPFAGKQPPPSQGRVDQVTLAAAPLPTARPLALPDSDTRALEETDEPRPVAAGALDREGGHAELERPGKQRAVARFRRFDLTAVELGAKPVERNRDMHVLVGVDPDCDRPLHDLASLPSKWSTGLDRAVSSKGRRLLSGHRPVERSGGGRQVGFKALDPPAWL